MNPARPRPRTDAERRKRAKEVLGEALPEGIAIVAIRTGDAVTPDPHPRGFARLPAGFALARVAGARHRTPALPDGLYDRPDGVLCEHRPKDRPEGGRGAGSGGGSGGGRAQAGRNVH